MNTPAAKLIPPLISNLSSKSAEIRKRTSEFLELLLRCWETHFIERHQGILSEAIKKSLSDADSEARAFSRKAFWAFHEHFPDQANALMNSLEPAKQKQLQGELSGSSSKTSLTGSSGTSTVSRSRSVARPATARRPATSGASRGGQGGVVASSSSSSLQASRARSA